LGDNHTTFIFGRSLEYWLKNKEEAVSEYIRGHNETSKNMVAKFMVENEIMSRETSDNIVDELIKQRKVIDNKKGNSRHKLVLNDKNTYNDYVNRIKNLSETAIRWTNAVNSYSKLFESSRGSDHKNLAQFAQIKLNAAIIGLSKHIELSVKVEDDRDRLCLLMNEVLRNSYGVNGLISSWLIKRLEQSAKIHKNLNNEESEFIGEATKVISSSAANGLFPDFVFPIR
jgi:hypothetical protein